VILNFSKDFKSPIYSMLFLQTVLTNLVLTKSSDPKRHVIAFTELIFAGFWVCHTDLSRGEIAIAAFPPTPALTYPPP
jgi:hypothetical protein